MAKNVWDLALLMDVMHGNDPEDPISKWWLYPILRVIFLNINKLARSFDGRTPT